MRIAVVIFLLIVNSSLFSRSIPADDVDPWRAHFGLMAGMNTSVMQMKGGFEPLETSTSLWTAAFGIYFKSNEKNMFRFEAQTGYEVAGAGREHFYRLNADESVRIYDRYRTIPLTVLLTRNFGWKEIISLGVGFKSSFIVNYSTRHAEVNHTGIIFSPEVLRWYGSPVLQLSGNFQYAEVALCGWYAATPVIDQYDIVASPYGITLLVKARLFELGAAKF